MAKAVMEGQGDATKPRNDNPLPNQGFVAICHHLAQGDISSGGGIRTPDTRIMIPPACDEIPEENGNTEQSAAPGAAASAENIWGRANAVVSTEVNQAAPLTEHDTDLAEVVDCWSRLPEAVRLAVMALVRSTRR